MNVMAIGDWPISVIKPFIESTNSNLRKSANGVRLFDIFPMTIGCINLLHMQ